MDLDFFACSYRIGFEQTAWDFERGLLCVKNILSLCIWDPWFKQKRGNNDMVTSVSVFFKRPGMQPNSEFAEGMRALTVLGWQSS